MLNEVCPRCGSLIFRTDGETLCVVCGDRFILVKTDQEAVEEEARLRLSNIREILISKVEEIASEVPSAIGHDQISPKVLLMNEILDAIKKLDLIISKRERSS